MADQRSYAICQTSVLMSITSILVLTSVLPAVNSANVNNNNNNNNRPHIIFVVADDLGWNDIGFNNPAILTPNIDKLAETGIILNQSYVQPVCSPSRSAFMTGYYPFRMGLQHMVIVQSQPVCVPLDKMFLPEVLKANGYRTHIVGKWHLGFCDVKCTPLHRGFDSHFGYLGSTEDYYSKKQDDGFDFREDETVKWDAAGNYSMYQYADRVNDLLKGHESQHADQPLFLYYAMQSVHDPLQVPERYLRMYPRLENIGRKTMSAMSSAMDDAVGSLVTSLKDHGMYDNSVIVFTSDNGGSTVTGASNYPLRGDKITIWEGGTRAVGLIHSPTLSHTDVRYDGLIHAVDWFPTMLDMANIDYNDDDWDGVSQWQAIQSLSQSNREEFVYNLDSSPYPMQGQAAIRVGDYKLIEGVPGLYNDWYLPNTARCDVLPRVNYTAILSVDTFRQWAWIWVNFRGLYNLKDDPLEKTNIYESRPDIVKRLQSRLRFHQQRQVRPLFPPNDPASDPANFGGVWSPGWCQL